MKRLVIFGTTKLARMAYVYFSKDSPYEVVAFCVERQYLKEAELFGKPVVAFDELEKRYPPNEYSMFVAVGYTHLNKTRAKLYDMCKAMGYNLASYISSTVTHYGEIDAGDNCLLLENIVVQPFAKIGNNVILWCGCLLGHDSVIGDHCFVSAATIAGNVTVGPYCFIGVNATLRDGITVGAESVIGAGALLLKNAPPGSVYRGLEAERASFPSSRLRAI